MVQDSKNTGSAGRSFRSVASPPGPVGDVILTLHLDQPRDRALKLESAVTGGVDFLRRDLGRGDQQCARLVERVDQNVEAPCRVALRVGRRALVP